MLLKGLIPILPVQLRSTGSQLVLRASLLKGPRSHISSNVHSTSVRLVLYVTEGTSLPYFQ
jgi:hypothetical protein